MERPDQDSASSAAEMVAQDGVLGLGDFQYVLPRSAIAQAPSDVREHSRLMLMNRKGEGLPVDSGFAELPELVRGDELFVFNDSKVVPARCHGHKSTGGAVEFLFLAPVAGRADQARAMGRASKALRPGMAVVIPDAHGAEHTVTIAETLGDGHYLVALPDEYRDLWAFLDACGELPLPPYIAREDGPTPSDTERYQTTFARANGSVAAPTAGLHFTPALLAALRARGCETAFVTLHVGPGTFAPIRHEDLSAHTMHAETYEIPEVTAQSIARAREEGRPVVAVGTTVVRTLEASAAIHGMPVPERRETDIFIQPGSSFRVVDQMVTNFHLPGSTLLVLVSAFAGRERVMAAYEAAVSRGYRFYSYGDGMWIR